MSTLEVSGAEATLRVSCQTLSLIEVVPSIDPDGDFLLSPAELAAGRDVVAAYFARLYRVGVPDGDGDRWLSASLASVELADEAREGPRDLQWMHLELRFAHSSPLETFAVDSRLFTETNPDHRDVFSLVWNGDERDNHLFAGGHERFEFSPADVRRPGVFGLFVRLGFDHILGGYDHLAFLLALLVAVPRLRSLIGVVTAFTVAHSITLALAALDVVDVPSRFVELAIALSIAYVACDNLLRKTPHTPWLEAFAFGLLHGLGFAGFLSDALTAEKLKVTALFGFNVGVELGQLGAVVALALVFRLVFRKKRRTSDAEDGEDGAPEGLTPAWFRLGASVAVALVGFYWFVERTGWI